jgi:hypothetical protein
MTFQDYLNKSILNEAEYKGDIYKTATEIQDASNLTAVVNTLASICERVLHDEKSTTAVRKNSAVIAIVDKINDLLGRPGSIDINKAFEDCEKKAGK